jgi:DNA replication protein DnaC
MNAELWDYFRESGCDGPFEFNGRDEELFLRHRALCRKCLGLDNCREHGFVLQISPAPDKRTVRLAMGPCKFRQAREVLRRSERLFSKAAIPPALRECSLENYVTEGRSESVRRAKSAAIKGAKTGCSLVLAGAVGTGKTHLAAAIARTALEQGRTALFISAIGYLEHLKSTFEGKQAGLYMERVDHVKSVNCLVIDDLGAESPSAWTIERLYDVINTRVERQAQTIVTTNFPNAPALMRRLSSDPFGAQRIASRLVSFGWVLIDGEDYRARLRLRQQDNETRQQTGKQTEIHSDEEPGEETPSAQP